MIKRLYPERDITQLVISSLPSYYNQLREVTLPDRPETDGTVWAIIRIDTSGLVAPLGISISKFEWADPANPQTPNINGERYELHIVKLTDTGKARVGITAGSAPTYLMGYIYGRMADYIYMDDDPVIWYSGTEWPAYPESLTLTEPTRAGGVNGVVSIPADATIAKYLTYSCVTYLYVGAANRSYYGTYHGAAIDDRIYRTDVYNTRIDNAYKAVTPFTVNGIALGFSAKDIYDVTDPDWKYPQVVEYGRLAPVMSAGLPYVNNDWTAESSSSNTLNKLFFMPVDGVTYPRHKPFYSIAEKDRHRMAVFSITGAIVNTAFHEEEDTMKVTGGVGIQATGTKVPVGLHYNTVTTSVDKFTTTVIDLNELKFKLSGGVSNTQLPLSLGGGKSTHSLDTTDRILVGDITADMGGRGARLGTCLYLENETGYDAVGLSLYVVLDNVHNADILLAIGQSEVDGYEPVIPVPENTMSFVVTKAAYSEASALKLPRLAAGSYVAIWLVIDLSTGVSYNNESFRLVINQRA